MRSVRHRAAWASRAVRRLITSRFGIAALLATVYLALSFLPFWGAWSHGPSYWLQAGGRADVGQEVFFLAQVPAALIHRVNPLANSWTNWPYGANYMVNTGVPLLALLMSPITLATNPIFSLNLLFTLTVWADCVVGYLVVAHLTRNRLAGFIAGLLFGFSPMMTAAAYGHVHVTFDLLPPVMFLLVWRLATGAGRPIWNGIALGVAMAIQLYVFAEPLADCVVVAAIGLAIAAVVYRHQLAERLVPFLRGAVAAAASFLVLGGYGLYMEVAGPQHITGDAHRAGLLTLTADLLGPVLPTNNQRFTLGLGATGSRLTSLVVAGKPVPDGAENGAYLGIPLLLVLIVAVVWLWRVPLMRWAAGLGVVAFVFSMGSKLRVDGHLTPLRLPFDVIARVPLLKGATAARYAMIEWFFVALMVGIAACELYRSVSARLTSRSQPSFVRIVPGAAVAAVAAFALVPLVPSWPYLESPVPLPTLAVGSQLRSLPAGQVVVGYPFPSMNTSLMVIQAQDKMRFRLVGGSLIQPASNGQNLYSAAPPSTCQSILNSYYLPVRPVNLTAKTLASCAHEMLHWNVKTVLWTKLGQRPDAAEAFFTALLGPPTIGASDSALWLDPQPALRGVVADGGISAAARAKSRPTVVIAVPRVRSGCGLTATVSTGKFVTAAADWVNVSCHVTDPKLTVQLLQNGKEVTKATISVPGGVSFRLSVTGGCHEGDSYQTTAAMTARQDTVPSQSRVVTAGTC